MVSSLYEFGNVFDFKLDVVSGDMIPKMFSKFRVFSNYSSYILTSTFPFEHGVT